MILHLVSIIKKIHTFQCSYSVPSCHICCKG